MMALRSASISSLGLLLVALLLSAPPATARVVLLGIDGAAWPVLDSLLAAGELPHLSRLLERGVSANLETVEPVTSPVVWSIIATGRNPDALGITDFLATGLAIQVPTVFERLAASGLRVGLYDYLVTWPPAVLSGGFVIPGWLRRDAAVTPADVWSRAGVSPYVNAYRGAMRSAEYLALARSVVREKAPRFISLAKAFDLDVGALTLYAIDMTSHRFWHGAYPGDFEEPIRVGVKGRARR
jgi:hypothetical protein